jgi:hypothetical protein
MFSRPKNWVLPTTHKARKPVLSSASETSSNAVRPLFCKAAESKGSQRESIFCKLDPGASILEGKSLQQGKGRIQKRMALAPHKNAVPLFRSHQDCPIKSREDTVAAVGLLFKATPTKNKRTSMRILTRPKRHPVTCIFKDLMPPEANSHIFKSKSAQELKQF